MGVREGLLALLRPDVKHGYQLRGEFEALTGEMWPLNIGQVYTSLQRLERDELIALADDSGDRKRYAITGQGRSAVRRWLLEAEAVGREARDEVAMKILVADASAAADPFDVIAAQRETTMRALQDLTRRKADTGDDRFAALVLLDRLILRCRAELDWLDLVEARLEARPGGAATDPDVVRAGGA